MKIILEGSSKEIKEFMNTYKDLKDVEVEAVKNKKYELTDDTIYVNGHALRRIKALKDFGDVKKGDLGGYLETEDNLSQKGDCWIYNDAKVYGVAKVYDNAKVLDNATVFGFAKVYNNAEVYGFAKIWGGAEVYDNAMVFGHAMALESAKIYRNAYIRDGVVSRYERIIK